ncbi:MAG: serine/threonine protein kinase, partial [Myxococcales bacterium]
VIERVLGQGGMGLVLQARHAQLGQPVAIKVIRPGAGVDAESNARFLREAWAAATLNSEHIVRVSDVGVLPSGAPFMVMEYIEGQDLARLAAARGPLPWGEAIGYVLEACVGLAEAHARGIVHRDLKPSNLFLAQQSGTVRLKVLDFGIAKAPVARSAVTAGHDVPSSSGGALALTGAVGLLGTPYYMAPEQFRSARDVDGRADVWALGVILHELLAGALPFPGRTLDEVLAAMAAGAPDVRRGRPDVPAGVAQVIQACLQPDLSRRVPTVGRLAAALAPFVPASAALAERAARVLGEPAVGPVHDGGEGDVGHADGGPAASDAGGDVDARSDG